MNCVVCRAETAPLFQKYAYWINRCPHCGHQAVAWTPPASHLEQVYSDHYFHGGGDGYPDYLAESKLLTAHGRRYGRLLAQYMAPGTVLDVGAAAGFLLKGLQETGWTGVGLEPNATMAALGRDRLGLTMVTGDLERFTDCQPFDLVSMIQVIAHFHDLAGALQRAAALTKSGGFWLIESWNRDSLPARLLGEQWHEYSPPSVLHWFAPADLRQLAARYGFTPVAQGRPQKWINAAHAKSLLRYKLQGRTGYRYLAGALQLAPDELALPYPAFDLFWMLFQKQTP
jgi:SAM-dependent methyltransferase